MVAHRVGVDQQGLGHLLCRPAARQQHHRLDAVGLALVVRGAVRPTQFGEFLGGEGIVEHADDDKAAAGYATPFNENLR